MIIRIETSEAGAVVLVDVLNEASDELEGLIAKYERAGLQELCAAKLNTLELLKNAVQSICDQVLAQ